MSFLKPNRASQPAGRTTDRSLLLTPTKTIRNDKKTGRAGKTWNGNAGSTKVTCILFESRFMLSRVTLFYSLSLSLQTLWYLMVFDLVALIIRPTETRSKKSKYVDLLLTEQHPIYSKILFKTYLNVSLPRQVYRVWLQVVTEICDNQMSRIIEKDISRNIFAQTIFKVIPSSLTS